MKFLLKHFFQFIDYAHEIKPVNNFMFIMKTTGWIMAAYLCINGKANLGVDWLGLDRSDCYYLGAWAFGLWIACAIVYQDSDDMDGIDHNERKRQRAIRVEQNKQ